MCGFPTFLAFAGDIHTGKTGLSCCPYISQKVLGKYSDRTSGAPTIAENIDNAMQILKSERSKVNPDETATRIGVKYSTGRLPLEVLGKPYSINDSGDIFTDIHLIPWVSLPVYKYIMRIPADTFFFIDHPISSYTLLFLTILYILQLVWVQLFPLANTHHAQPES